MFKPLHYLRAHARNNDATDIKTQVWSCAFEPDPYIPGEYTNVVATCGGNSVCFIDVKSGCVLKKLTSEYDDIFYTVAWGKKSLPESLNSRQTILAAAGSKRRVYLFTPNESQCVCSKPQGDGTKTVVNSLLFHPKQHDILFSAFSSGDVKILKVHIQHKLNPLTELHSLKLKCQIYQLAFSLECSTLLAACDMGVRVWPLNSDLTTENILEYDGVNVDLPTPPGVKSQVTLVDSVVILGTGSLVASKRCQEGHILVWDLAKALANTQGTPHKKKNLEEIRSIKVTQGRFLRWSKTDNYFMGLGWNECEKVLACGDDKGCVWLYNLDCPLGKLSDIPLKPCSTLPWPKRLSDTYVDKCRKLNIGTYDIVLAQVVLTKDYLVTITDNNLVCVWHRLQ